MRTLLFWVIAILLVGTLIVATTLPHWQHAEVAQSSAPISAHSAAPASPATVALASKPSGKAATENDTPVAINLDGLRRGVPISQEATPLPMARVENNDEPRARNYPMQPPTIPHSIDNYQVDKNYNRCLMCHTRANAAKFNATAIPPSHYVTREGHVLAEISPRRYFCIQCHVPQTNAKPLVGNTYQYDTAASETATQNGQ